MPFFLTLGENVTYFINIIIFCENIIFYFIVLTLSALMTKTQYFTVAKRVTKTNDIILRKRFVLNCIVRNANN